MADLMLWSRYEEECRAERDAAMLAKLDKAAEICK